MEGCTKGGIISIPSLPEVEPITNVETQKLVEKLAESVKRLSGQLVQDKKFNDEIDGLARLGDRNIFPKLVEFVFNDGQISWERIFVLFYAAAKLAVKMVLANLPKVFSEILDLCLEFFKTELLRWIHKMGGWGSISALSQFFVKYVQAFFNFLSIEIVLVFICGFLFGAAIAWKINKSSSKRDQ